MVPLFPSLRWVACLLGLVLMGACSQEAPKNEGVPTVVQRPLLIVENESVRLRILDDELIDSSWLDSSSYWSGEDYYCKVDLQPLSPASHAFTIQLVDSTLLPSKYAGFHAGLPENPKAWRWFKYESIRSRSYHFSRPIGIPAASSPVKFKIFYYSSLSKYNWQEWNPRRYFNYATDSIHISVPYEDSTSTNSRWGEISFIIAIDSATGKHSYAPARPLEKY